MKRLDSMLLQSSGNRGHGLYGVFGKWPHQQGVLGSGLFLSQIPIRVNGMLEEWNRCGSADAVSHLNLDGLSFANICIFIVQVQPQKVEICIL